MPDDKVEVQNVNIPDQITRVDRAKYEAMRKALLGTLTDEAPGATVKEALATLKPHLPEDLFPGGKTSGWWLKCVQLDLEAKGLVARAPTKPMRIHKT